MRRILLLATIAAISSALRPTLLTSQRHRAVIMSDNDDLASQFAAEQRRRQTEPPKPPEPPSERTEVREIIIDADGKPQSIPKRPAPPPANFAADGAADLVQNPQFFFGVFIAMGSLVLLLAIAAADNAVEF